MRPSEHPLTIRAMALLGVELTELRAIERRPDDCEERLEKFKDEIRSAYRRGVLKHHPDKGGDPEALMTIKKFCDWVKGWTIRPRRAAAMRPIPINGAPGIEVIVQMHEDFLSQILEGLGVFEQTSNRAATAADDFARAVQEAAARRQARAQRDHPPVETGSFRGSYSYRSAPTGTRVDRKQTREGTRVHRVRKDRKP